jgi:DNA end-binding protein Ku
LSSRPYEVRKEDEYFDDIPDEKTPKDMLELASHIVETKSGHFNPEEFEDQYEDALKELLKKKQAGEKIGTPKERAPAKVINLMDALRRQRQPARGVPETNRSGRTHSYTAEPPAAGSRIRGSALRIFRSARPGSTKDCRAGAQGVEALQRP